MATRPGKQSTFQRSPCPIAATLDLVGDKWSLLVIRDMLHGKGTYGELLESPEGIPTNILADRLKRMESAGIVVRTAYQHRPVRYTYLLSAKGRDLGRVLLALVGWGKKHLPGTRTLKESTPAAARRHPAGRATRVRKGAVRAG
jgi:DNA-binding HxlR family transcriptional regulator